MESSGEFVAGGDRVYCMGCGSIVSASDGFCGARVSPDAAPSGKRCWSCFSAPGAIRPEPSEDTETGTTKPSLTRTDKPPAEASDTTPDTVELQAQLERLADFSSGRVSVVARGLDGYPVGTEVAVEGDGVFRSASIIKLLVLAELLHRVDEGSVSLDEPLGDGTVGSNAAAMVSASDNAATNYLIDHLGFGNTNYLAAELGLTDTVLARKMLDTKAAARGEENYTSASDTADLLAAIHGDQLLSSASRDYALALLEAQQLNGKIPAGLPAGTRVLHKTGELDGIEHDAGIVVTPDGRAFVLVVLTEGDAATNISVIREAARITYRELAKAP